MMPVLLEGHYREDTAYETVVVNVTERCKLRYAHSFVYRDANRGSLLRQGARLFARSTVTTSGTPALADRGPKVLDVVSLDGPGDVNDALRGCGTYRRVMRNLRRLRGDLESPVQERLEA